MGYYSTKLLTSILNIIITKDIKTMSKHLIDFIDISKSYDNNLVLDELNLYVRENEFLTLLGPSGCGKTTTLRLLGGFETPDKGKILFDGADITNVPANERKLNTVFQKYSLFPHMSIAENIAFGLKISKKSKAYINDKIKYALKLVNLDGFENRSVDSLSGGQQQRIAIARAIVNEPKVLLLDEPFAAIDAKVRGELRTWLKELVEKLGITSIFVTHDQDEAVEVADEIIITNHGTIEQMGTPLEIYKSPDTPFVAQFIGHTTVVENYDRLKGFDRIENADKAVIRPEFIKISKSGNLDRYQSAAEEGIVTDVVFRGNRMDITVSINGIEVVGERSLEKDLIAVGEKVHVLIYRLYIFDEEKTYLMENSEMQEQDVFYI